MRGARDQQRIGEVAIRSLLGDMDMQRMYSRGDVVRYNGRMWIFENSSNYDNLAQANRFPAAPNIATVGWGGGGGIKTYGILTWVCLLPELINKTNTWDSTADGKIYARGQIVVWNGRFYYRESAPYANNPEPGSSASLAATYWTEFKIGRR
jgi:hypothetical protein